MEKHEVTIEQREVPATGGIYCDRTLWRIVAECTCGWKTQPLDTYEQARKARDIHIQLNSEVTS